MRAAILAGILLAGCVTPPTDPAEPDDAGGSPVTYDAVRIETRLGEFTAILFCGETPITCEFFQGLVESGYYDGRAFGRVIPGFVIQEVDRTGGTTDQPERVAGEFGTAAMFSAGAFGIARDADPDSGSSEFFVMDFAISSLYGNYTAFAQVVEGQEVVHAIARVQAVKTGPASAVAGSPPGSPVYFGVHDRVPVDPVAMDVVTLTTITLDAADAARYPIQVGETFVAPRVRATLEWPADLASGAESELAWYVSARAPPPTCEETPVGTQCAPGTGSVQDPEPLDLAGATIRFDGAASGSLTFEEDAAARGKLALRWAPPAAGSYQLHLERDGGEIALANLTVAR